MIIFGTRIYTRVLATLMLVCQRCGTPAAHHVAERVTRFTLFFVPLFPIGARRSLTCTFCGAATPISKEQAQQYEAQAQAPQQYQQSPAQQQPQYQQAQYQQQPQIQQPPVQQYQQPQYQQQPPAQFPPQQ